jgi:hypothetical protein
MYAYEHQRPLNCKHGKYPSSDTHIHNIMFEWKLMWHNDHINSIFQVNLLVDIVILIPFICRKFNQYGIDKVKRSCLEISKLVHLGGDALTMTIHCQDITCLSAYW